MKKTFFDCKPQLTVKKTGCYSAEFQPPYVKFTIICKASRSCRMQLTFCTHSLFLPLFWASSLKWFYIMLILLPGVLFIVLNYISCFVLNFSTLQRVKFPQWPKTQKHFKTHIRAGRYIEYTRCIAACSLWDIENDYIMNIRVYIQLSRSCF